MEQTDHVIKIILAADNYYDILNIDRTAKSDDIRKAFLYRSRLVHPGKLFDDVFQLFLMKYL